MTQTFELTHEEIENALKRDLAIPHTQETTISFYVRSQSTDRGEKVKITCTIKTEKIQ